MDKPRAVITGAAGGIGRCLTQGFADAGYQVIGLDLEAGWEAGAEIGQHAVDLSSETAVEVCFKAVTAQYGPPHVLVNNAAVAHFHKPLLDLSAAEWDAVLGVNLRGAFLCAKAFVQANAGEAYGRIINIASTRWHQNEADWEAYGASKGGLVSLTNSLCVSLAHTPITVNAISPGWIETLDYGALSEADHKQHPSGRVGRPSDVLRACLFLADAENDFINGANLVVDGGMTKRMIYR